MVPKVSPAIESIMDTENESLWPSNRWNRLEGQLFTMRTLKVAAVAYALLTLPFWMGLVVYSNWHSVSPDNAEVVAFLLPALLVSMGHIVLVVLIDAKKTKRGRWQWLTLYEFINKYGGREEVFVAVCNERARHPGAEFALAVLESYNEGGPYRILLVKLFDKLEFRSKNVPVPQLLLAADGHGRPLSPGLVPVAAPA